MSSSPVSESGGEGVCVGRALLPLPPTLPSVTSCFLHSRLRITTGRASSTYLLPSFCSPHPAAHLGQLRLTPPVPVPPAPSLGPWLLAPASLVVPSKLPTVPPPGHFMNCRATAPPPPPLSMECFKFCADTPPSSKVLGFKALQYGFRYPRNKGESPQSRTVRALDQPQGQPVLHPKPAGTHQGAAEAG